MRQNFCKRFRKVRSLISAVGVKSVFVQETSRNKVAMTKNVLSIAILNVSRMNDGVEQQA